MTKDEEGYSCDNREHSIQVLMVSSPNRNDLVFPKVKEIYSAPS